MCNNCKWIKIHFWKRRRKFAVAVRVMECSFKEIERERRQMNRSKSAKECMYFSIFIAFLHWQCAFFRNRSETNKYSCTIAWAGLNNFPFKRNYRHSSVENCPSLFERNKNCTMSNAMFLYGYYLLLYAFTGVQSKLGYIRSSNEIVISTKKEGIIILLITKLISRIKSLECVKMKKMLKKLLVAQTK